MSLRNGVLFLLALVACLHWWRASAGSMGGVLVWVPCFRGWPGWRASVGGVLRWVTWFGVLAWVTWQPGWRDWCASVDKVVGMLACVAWVAHYFSNSFQKLTGNEYCSKLEKEFRFHIIYTLNISCFLEFPLDIWIQTYFKVVFRIDSEL